MGGGDPWPLVQVGPGLVDAVLKSLTGAGDVGLLDPYQD